jgi:hypothetical protein
MEGGLADHVKDLIILTAGSQALSLVSTWLWLLLLLAPLRALYKLWTGVIGPWIFAPGEEPDEVRPVVVVEMVEMFWVLSILLVG